MNNGKHTTVLVPCEQEEPAFHGFTPLNPRYYGPLLRPQTIPWPRKIDAGP